MKDTAFDKLIDRYLKDRLTAEEKQKVEAWLDQLAINPAELQLSEAEKAEAQKKIYQQLCNKIAEDEKPVQQPFIIRLKPFLKVAACIAFFSVLIWGLHNQLKTLFNSEHYTVISNSKGHITKSILADGTLVWLKGNSKLYFPIRFLGNMRTVTLEGEALFEVAKDVKHPFIIHCGALTTKVLGTSFNIKQNQNETEVAVLTGRVFLSSKNPQSVTLLPFQKGLYQEHEKTLVKEAQPTLQVEALTAGTEYNMLFNDVRLTEVLKRIGQKFEVNIEVENQELNNMLVTADLTDQSLLNTLSMICEALNLNYQLDEQHDLISKKQKPIK